MKILAHNNLCGRLIGKKGVIIKGIMDETETTLAVSRCVKIIAIAGFVKFLIYEVMNILL